MFCRVSAWQDSLLIKFQQLSVRRCFASYDVSSRRLRIPLIVRIVHGSDDSVHKPYLNRTALGNEFHAKSIQATERAIHEPPTVAEPTMLRPFTPSEQSYAWGLGLRLPENNTVIRRGNAPTIRCPI